MTLPAHVLVFYEPSRPGDASLGHAAEIAARAGARLTVVTVAVAEPEDGCCDTRAGYWNEVVLELAGEELDRARDAIGPKTDADFRVVSGRSVPTALAHEAQRSGADVVVVPRRRSLFPWGRSRHARQVQRQTPHAVVLQVPS